MKSIALTAWMLSVLYYPGVTTETYDPNLQEPNICLEQIRSENTWPIGRMGEDFKKEVMDGKSVIRPVFVGCYNQSFQEEYNLFEKIVVDQAPSNKWYSVDFDDKGDYGYQGAYTLEECMKHFFRTFPADDPVIAGCVNEPGLKVLKGVVHSRFIHKLYLKKENENGND